MIRDFIFFCLGGATMFIVAFIYFVYISFVGGFMRPFHRGQGTAISGGEGNDTIININVPDKKRK